MITWYTILNYIKQKDTPWYVTIPFITLTVMADVLVLPLELLIILSAYLIDKADKMNADRYHTKYTEANPFTSKIWYK